MQVERDEAVPNRDGAEQPLPDWGRRDPQGGRAMGE